ncbi:hypothetical protein BJ508DRAFT_311425 [Ascobolus immersus RN42]|uniref:F-box domain-containing protein n=1 Tax=Ascobolus immersus RN42 TaxID=1160509 RepID=A0A3N4HW74_ASCIM|nr:hypothetical protein BJ508DRAFT_311425 [Ascobolus immersus RN42]
MDVPVRHSFLGLPLEMRLEVYSCCSVLSLLMLRSTCNQLHAEIMSRPSIISSSYGYQKYYGRDLSPKFERTTNALPARMSFGCSDIDRVTDEIEADLFNDLFCLLPTRMGAKFRIVERQVACTVCFCIQPGVFCISPYFRNPAKYRDWQAEGLKMWDTCAYCLDSMGKQKLTQFLRAKFGFTERKIKKLLRNPSFRDDDS